MKKHVHLYDAVHVPYPTVRRLIRDHPDRILHGPVQSGLAGVKEATTSVGLDLGGFHLAKEITLEVRSFVDVPGRVPLCRSQIRCEPADHSTLFPIIDADLEVEPIDDERSMLSLLGIYEPPLGAIGAAVDRLAMHHMAEVALRHLFTDLRHRIRDEADAAADTADAPEPKTGRITG